MSTPPTPFTEAPADPGLEADVRLEPEIAPAMGAAPVSPTPGVVLLTGATGFLGAFLLRELLARTAARIVCLVRAPDAVAAHARIAANLRHCGLVLAPADWARVEPLAGDVAQPQLGLTAAEHAALAARVEAVMHSAAEVNFYKSYGELRATNVGGVREILRFVVRGRAKALHYVSTAGVFDGRAYRGVTVRETDEAASYQGNEMGYTRSKWAAERLVLAARARGVAASIYRAPFIMGDTATGMVDADNLVVRMLAGSLAAGWWVACKTPVEMVPVDSLARAIVFLAGHEAGAGRTFHLTGPEAISWAELGRRTNACGHALEIVDYYEWKERLREFGRRKDNAMRPLLRFYLHTPRGLEVPVPEIYGEHPRPVFDSAATRALLAPAGLVPPPIGPELLARYLAYFERAGWVPATATAACA